MASSVTRIRRVDSAGLEFSAAADWALVEVTLLDVFQVDLLTVYGLEKISDKRVVIKFSAPGPYQRFVSDFAGRSHLLPGSAGTVEVSDRCVAPTFVSIHGVPLDFPEEVLRTCFSRYGTVFTHRITCLRSGRLSGLRTNVRTLGMRLTRDIPSQVKFYGFNMRVFYEDQPRTCFRCGLRGHLAAGCTASGMGEPAIFQEGDFPPLGVGGAKPGGAETVFVPRGPSSLLVPSASTDPTPAVQQFDPPGSLVSDVAPPLPVHVVTAEVHRASDVAAMETGTSVEAAPSCVGGSGDPAGPSCGVAPSSGGRSSDVVAAAPEVLRSSRGSRGPSPVATSDQPRRKREARTHSSDRGPPIKRGGSTAGAAVACAPPPPPSGGLMRSVAPGAPSGGSDAPGAVAVDQWVVSSGVEGPGRDALTLKFTKSTKSASADVPVGPSSAGLPDGAPTVPTASHVGGSAPPSTGAVGLVGSSLPS